MGVVSGCSYILLLYTGVMAAGCWSELRVVASKSIGDILFGCFSEVLLRAVFTV